MWHRANSVDKDANPIVDQVGDALVDDFAGGGRPLSGPEVALLHPLYLDTVDYGRVEIMRDRIASADGTARTVGNRIYMPAKYFVRDSGTGQPTDVLTPAGEDTLVHEMGHVWQYQHSGLDYIPAALIAMAEAAITEGDRSAAYEWQPAARAGVPFAELNPEQQAQCFEDYNAALRRIRAGTPWATDVQDVSLATPYVTELQRSGRPPPNRKPPAVNL